MPTASETQLALHACLQRCSYNRLRRMGAFLQVGLQGADRNRKEAWIEAICQRYRHAGSRYALWNRLSPEARQACFRLRRAKFMPARPFLAELGNLRPMDSLHKPFSPAEELYLAALLFGTNGGDPKRRARLALPADLVDAFPFHPAQDAPQGRTGAAFSLQPPPLLHDLAQTLIFFCFDQGAALQHGRWLTRHAARNLAQRLYRPLALPADATHKQTTRLRNIMFWAVACGFLSDGQLTPAAWQWLALEPAAALRQLWTRWLLPVEDGQPDWRAIYAQPDAAWSDLLKTGCRARLAAMDGEFDAAALADALLGDATVPAAYYAAHFEKLSDFDATVTSLLATVFSDLGLVTTTGREHGYRVTAIGRWLLNVDGALPALKWHAGARIAEICEVIQETPASGAQPTQTPILQIRLSRWAPPHAQALLALFADGNAPPRAAGHCYRLCRQSVATAAAQGHGLPLLLNGLTALGIAPTDAQIAQLWRWWQHGGEVTVELLPVVRTQNAVQMAALCRSAALKRLLGDPLAPTLATWAGDPAALIQALRAAGFFPATHLPTEPAGTPAEQPAGDGALWLAGQLYLLLGESLPLPLPLSSHRLTALFDALPPTQQAALEVHLANLRRGLGDLLDGLPFLPPPLPTNPLTWQKTIEQAIEDQAVLTILYHSAGRNLKTRRRIQPLWQETHRGVAYVRAQCIDTGAVLTFRLDRIFEISP